MPARLLLAALFALVLSHAGVQVHLSAADLALPVLVVVAAFAAASVVLVRLVVADRRAGWRPSVPQLPARCPVNGTSRRCCELVAAPEARKAQPWSP